MNSEFSELDYRYMTQALRLAARGLYTTDPNPRVGCVIVNQDRVIAKSWHQRAGSPHAEILALKQAGKQADGATAYVSLEPCCHQGRTAPCTQALIAAKIGRVVAAIADPNPDAAGGVLRLQQAGVKTSLGLLADQAKVLNCGFFKRMQTGRPYLRLKMAMSLDGRTALANGVSRWITGDQARADVHHWRARSSAIMTGVGTVLADDPDLNSRLRLQDGSAQDILQPTVVILDSQLQLKRAAKLFKFKRPTLLFTANKHRGDFPATTEVISVQAKTQGLDLVEVLQQLGTRQINEVLVEAGSTLAGSLIQANLVDEILLYIAPSFLGNQSRGLLDLPIFESMQQRINVKISEIRCFGDDLRLILHPVD